MYCKLKFIYSEKATKYMNFKTLQMQWLYYVCEPTFNAWKEKSKILVIIVSVPRN